MYLRQREAHIPCCAVKEEGVLCCQEYCRTSSPEKSGKLVHQSINRVGAVHIQTHHSMWFVGRDKGVGMYVGRRAVGEQVTGR